MADLSSIVNWAQQVNAQIDTLNPSGFAKLFSPLCEVLAWRQVGLLQESEIIDIGNKYFAKYDNQVGPGLKNLCVNYLSLCRLIATHPINWKDVLKRSSQLLDVWLDLYLDERMQQYNWLVPCLHTICNILFKCGSLADKQERVGGHFGDDEFPQDTDANSKEALNMIRSKLGRVRGEEDRHPAYIVLLGHSIKGCMQLGNMQMAAGFLKAIESTTINPESCPLGPLINFRYYLGKLHMQQDRYKQADENLSWAFTYCGDKHIKAKRAILECLVVVRICLGQLPPKLILKKYGMEHHLDIVKGIKIGNIQLFEQTLEKYISIFIQKGTILCVERFKYLVIRTLVKRAKQWWNEAMPDQKPNMVPIPLFTALVKWQIHNLDNDEMICLCANLIRLGYIKGYISWEHQTLVFSKIQPFPPIIETILE
ncbi:PCI domain-containing protein 2 [Babesia microti strain RI]|uniref:PCI domain-containing protein 2 n=1 Tax=Babesia microti (strain RI) TaxID=1133968 RepID=A0A1R4ABS0_BABMR|nr:PCI domain-containing protein 2 [Babesia microti strain RI]SJK86446.1 PCI domain-containing protein 2 [Babesia microti strain RI]|eukprot:XP_021338603.1 PCI domain-containing protein 2 [Babesia microti strain RI]